MNLDNNIQKNRRFQLTPVDGRPSIKIPSNKKRILIGRTNTCDVMLMHPEISAIHCVLEISDDCVKVYDMNSSNGTFVNGEKVIVKEVAVGGTIQLANHGFFLREQVREELPPPILDVLSDLPPVMEEKKVLPKAAPVAAPVAPTPKVEPVSDKLEDVPVIEYPLAKDPKAEFSEYIFEDTDTLYPIFNYQTQKTAVEVIILFKDKIYSVDYLPEKDGVYNLVGSSPKGRDIEFAYLSKDSKESFVEIKGGEIFITPLNGYEFTSLSDTKKVLSSSISLNTDDILCFRNGDLQIYVRGTEAPPKVKHAPLISKDNELKKYVLVMLMFMGLFGAAMGFFQVDKELEKEKAPNRIATILYKKKFIPKKAKAVAKTKKAKKLVQKSKKQPKKEAPKAAKKVKAKKTPKPIKKIAKPGPKKPTTKKVRKAVARKAPQDNLKTTKVRKPSPRKAAKKAGPSKARRVSKVRAKSKGHVDTYKSFDFSSSVSSILSKGGAASKVKVAKSYASKTGYSGVSGGGESATLKKAQISHKTGDLSGVAGGTLDTSRGTEGLASKRSVYTVGIPAKTDIIGSMDPDIIRQILRANFPKFRSCYQRVLARSSEAFGGVLPINFVIGASGHVTRAGFTGSVGQFPAKVRKCVVNVMRGIKFPEPMGGGVVEVNQPMNFYPNMK